MIELAWFAAGAVVGGGLWSLLRRRAGPAAAVAAADAAPAAALPPAAPPAPPPPPPLPPALPPAAANLPDLRSAAASLADELANLVSGVEGRAHQLIEAAPSRAQLPGAAERLLAAVQRLRTLHSKLVALGQGRTAPTGTADVRDLAAGLGAELQHLQLGLEVRWAPPAALPPVACSAEIVRDALLFLCAALLRAERGASRLVIEAEPGFEADGPVVHLALALEWIDDAPPAAFDPTTDATFTLDFEAATNLIGSQGGRIALSHLPGRSVRAVVSLPAVRSAAPAAAPAPAPAAEPPPRHRYGGALVLEADPAIRAMLASELKAAGRAVFACADGAAARSFLEATPERFELLILDHPQLLEASDPLAQTIRAHAPQLKICVLTRGQPPPQDGWPRLCTIQKPFGVHELREALATVLAAS